MELTFRTAGIGDLELLTESRLRAIRTYRHLSETAALPHGLPDAVRDYYRQALASGSHIALLALVGERLAATGGLDLRSQSRGSVRPYYEHLDGSCLPRPGDRMADAGSPHGSGL